MRIPAVSLALLLACSIGVNLASALLYSDNLVFKEAPGPSLNAPTVVELCKSRKVDPARVAYSLSEDIWKNKLFPNSQVSIYDLLYKVNRFKLRDCNKHNLKARLEFCEQFKDTPVHGFTFAKENVRLYCRSAFQLVAEECVRRTSETVEIGVNSSEYLEQLKVAVEKTEAARWNGETLDEKLASTPSIVEQFVLEH